MDYRSVNQRLDDLEHDNNVLRSTLADVQVENTRLSMEWESLTKRINKLCATVDDFVGRFSRVQ
jgi:regulator of replication initiation timing